MLVNYLSHYEEAEQSNAVCMAFLDTLPPEETIPLLKKRRTAIESLIAAKQSDQNHHGSFQLTIDLQIRHLQTDLEWLSDVIAHLESAD